MADCAHVGRVRVGRVLGALSAQEAHVLYIDSRTLGAGVDGGGSRCGDRDEFAFCVLHFAVCVLPFALNERWEG